MSAQRYTTTELPPYAFVPGAAPHPTRDPRGHSYSEDPEPPVPSVEPDDWNSSEDYLFGVDLYNEGFLWEAHEAWEGLWHVSKHDKVQAQFIQGLIQCTAGCLKIRMDQKRGMEKLFSAGIERLRSVVNDFGPYYMGLDIVEFADALQTFGEGDLPAVEDRPRLSLE
jgi:uncharacterized protein